ncbi:MAG: hypothetical protein ACKVPX_06280 [Myxococcaceae bacterium]
MSILLLAACQSPSREAQNGVLVLEDLLKAHKSDDTYAGLRPSDFVTPAGEPIPLLSPPFTALPTLQHADGDGINVMPAFSESGVAAYIVMEVWKDVPKVWVQPWWVFVTEWNPVQPGSRRVPDSLALIHVGTESYFYSPFWEILYAVVPPDSAADRYRRSSDMFSDNLPIYPASQIYAPLAAKTWTVASVSTAASPVRPFSANQQVGKLRNVNDIWLEGEVVPYVSLGSSGFTWDDKDVVPEVPLFMFTRADGETPAPELPAVIGTGPLGSNTPANLNPTGLPMFGGLTRLYTIRVPNNFGLFVPPGNDGLRTTLTTTTGVPMPAVHSDFNDGLGGQSNNVPLAPYALRIAADPECFSQSAVTTTTASAAPLTVAVVLQDKRNRFPDSCNFLDSQRQVESRLLSGSITRHELLFSSAFVLYGDRKVGP